MNIQILGIFGALLSSLAFATPAHAVMIGNGTVSAASNFVPTVNLQSMPATYTASFGQTFETSGTGAFALVTGLTGVMNGTLTFSSVVGTIMNEALSNFFVFNDGQNGTYNFSVSSVQTQSYVTNGNSNSVALYLLGTTLDAGLGLNPTPTSLTVTFNNTGGSAFSSSQTLAIPPAGLTQSVPEPISVALLGFGVLVAAGVRRRFAA